MPRHLRSFFLVLVIAVSHCSFLQLTTPVAGASQGEANVDYDAILLEHMMAQTFTVSVFTERYGVFNASLVLSASSNFPELIHGELIPTGTQRLETKEQWGLEHFSHNRSMLGVTPPQQVANAHPSLLIINIKMDYSGASAGTFSAWSLPAADRELQTRLTTLDEKEINPTVSASFSFLPVVTAAIPSSLSDIQLAPRMASGTVSVEDGKKGTFTLNFLSDHEFSLIVRLEGDTSSFDNIWAHGYAKPNDVLFPRRPPYKPPVWLIWLMSGAWLSVVLFQVISYCYSNNRSVQPKQIVRVAPPAKGKKVN